MRLVKVGAACRVWRACSRIHPTPPHPTPPHSTLLHLVHHPTPHPTSLSSRPPPCPPSSQALEGLALEVGRDAVQADTAEQWRSELLALLSAPSRRAALGERGRQFVETHHNWQTCLAPFAELLQLPARPAAARPWAPREAARVAS